MPKGQYKLSDIETPQQGAYKLSDIQPPTNQENVAAQAPRLDKYQADNTFMGTLGRGVRDELSNAPGAFVDDIGNAGKGLWNTITAPPSTKAEKIAAVAFPGAGAQLFRMGKGYYDSVQNEKSKADQSAAEHDPYGSAIHTASAALPLVGPLIGGVYDASKEGKGLGTGVSRILQAASMAPEGSPIPNPVSSTLGVASRGLKNLSYDTMNNALGTFGRDKNYSIDPGRGVVQEGIVAGGKQGLLDNINKAIEPKAQQLNDIISQPQNAAKRLYLNDAVNEPFNRAINGGAAGVDSDASLMRLMKTQKEFNFERTPNPSTQEILYGGPRNLTSASPAEALDLRRSIAKRANFQGDSMDQVVPPVARQSYGATTDIFHRAIPEAAPVDAKLADLTTAKDVLYQNMQNRPTSPSPIPGGDVGAAGLGYLAGGPMGAGGGLLASKALGWTPVQTGVAQMLYRGGQAAGAAAPLAPYGTMAAAARGGTRDRLRFLY